MIEEIRRHWVIPFILWSVGVAGATYAVVNNLVIQPLRDDLARVSRQVDELREEREGLSPFVDIPRSTSGSNDEDRRSTPRETQRTELSDKIALKREDPGKGEDSQESLQQKSNGFTFSFEKCTRSGGTSVCEFTVVNHNQDRRMDAYLNRTRSALTQGWDDSGNTLAVKSLRLGNKAVEDGKYPGVQGFLLQDIPVSLVAEIGGISSKADAIARLDLWCWDSDNGQDFLIVFRDLAFNQQ